jgi:hypothetical protein
MSISVTSDAFRHGERIPVKYTGDGEDVSPPIRWAQLPAATKGLALVCDDPDAPSAEPFVHWVIYNVPADAPGLPEGVKKVPKPPTPRGALQGVNSFGKIGYNGPAPPRGHGVHHYHFRLYALDRHIALDPGLDRASVVASISGHVLDEGEIIGTYERK